MKRLFSVLVATLAVNFILVAGAGVWLWRTAGVDKTKALAVKELLFPKPAPAEEKKPAGPTTEPSVMLKLEELLARKAGGTAKEQVEFMQRTFDVQMAQLERKQRELETLQQLMKEEKKSLTEREKALAQERKAMQDQRQAAAKLESDKGFQDSLELYNSLPSKQVKTIFMSLSDETVVQYLQAMEPRSASRILKEFSKPEETTRVQKLMERMRQRRPGRQGVVVPSSVPNVLIGKVPAPKAAVKQPEAQPAQGETDFRKLLDKAKPPRAGEPKPEAKAKSKEGKSADKASKADAAAKPPKKGAAKVQRRKAGASQPKPVDEDVAADEISSDATATDPADATTQTELAEPPAEEQQADEPETTTAAADSSADQAEVNTEAAQLAAAGQSVKPIEQDLPQKQPDGQDPPASPENLAITPAEAQALPEQPSGVNAPAAPQAAGHITGEQAPDGDELSPTAQAASMPVEEPEGARAQASEPARATRQRGAPVRLGEGLEQPAGQGAESAPADLAKAAQQVVQTMEQFQDQFSAIEDQPEHQPVKKDVAAASLGSELLTLGSGEQARGTGSAGHATAPAPALALPPEARFAEANHPALVSAIRSELTPHGGTMEIRLDPPELGVLQVTVSLRDGMLEATFRTSNDEATKVLSHSLNQLKDVLESQGVSVEKLRVQQSPRQEQPSGEQRQGQHGQEESNARQEQQRREMLKRMWDRVARGKAPVDVMA